MAKTITTVSTTDTFQTWLNKTNEMVGIFAGDAMTASGSGDSATGNSTLVGDFTATNLIATNKLSTTTIGNTGAGNTIAFTEPVNISGPDQIVATFTYSGAGAQTQYTNGTLSWDIGIKDSGGDFIMNTGGGTEELVLTTAGTLTVPNLIVSEDIVVTEDVTANNGIFNNVTINGSLGGLTTADVSEDPSAQYDSGTQYFTRARVASSLSAGSNITISEISNGVQEISATVNLSGYAQENTAVSFSSVTSTGNITADSGVVRANEFLVDGAYADTNNHFRIYGSGSSSTPTINWALKTGGTSTRKMYLASNLNVECSAYVYGTIFVYNGTDPTISLTPAGAIIAEGDITAFGSVSDINLKENIEVIPNALDKVSQLRGVTFNYKDKPEEISTGLIAQEVEQVLPGVVYEVDGSGESFKALRYGNTVGLLVEAIKELQDRIVELEKRCNCDG